MVRYLIVFIASTILLAASEPAWHSDYTSAQNTALSNGTKLFVFISTPDCTWCKKLEATTLSEPAIIERLDAGYASVHVTRDVDAYPKALKAVVVPMCYFLTADGTVIDYARGYWDTTDFNLILNDVDKRYKKMKEQQ